MGVLCINQVLDLLLLCAECVPCTVALLLYTGVENECRMAEGVSVLLTQPQRVAVERQDQGGVVVDPVQCLLARADLPVFRVCGIYPGGEGVQKGRKRLAESKWTFFFCNLSVVLVPLKLRVGGEPPWGHRRVHAVGGSGGAGYCGQPNLPALKGRRALLRAWRDCVLGASSGRLRAQASCWLL